MKGAAVHGDPHFLDGGGSNNSAEAQLYALQHDEGIYRLHAPT
jgi:hypothetical protein